MNRIRAGKPDGRGTPIEDPQVMQDALQMLFESETEFFIKVEGTATLPYASRIQQLHFPDGRFVLKLVRPLPHEMMPGAMFRMTFAVDDLRFEAVISLIGRDGYLQYGFHLPPCLFQADRRLHQRFPFRPRENAYVIAQDAGIPGVGVAGPLVNISMGGMALRVDRALRMEDGVRVPVNSALFERGKSFPRFRIQDLPLLHLLEGRAVSAHASEHGSELVLGMSFAGMSLEEETALARCLAFREKMYRGGQPPRPEGAAAPSRAGRGQTDGEEDDTFPELEDPGAEALPPAEVTVLLRLQRRTARVVLVMADGPVRQGIQTLLRQHGYHRLETVENMAQLRPMCEPGQRRALPGLILADLALARSGDAEPLAAARIIENQMAELGGLATAILCEEVDPTLLLAKETRTRFLPYPTGSGERWVETLDGMLA
jgi:hypothetical protein